MPSIYLIVDIIQNARRRAFEGNFDDAVARLYRCIEMIGQYTLLQYGIISSEVNLEVLRDKITSITLQKLIAKNNDNETIKIGLVEDFEILSELNKDDKVSITYTKYKEDFLKHINIRNESILAHGINPISKDKYDEIEEMSKVFIQSIIPDIDNKLTQIDRCFHYKTLEPNSRDRIRLS